MKDDKKSSDQKFFDNQNRTGKPYSVRPSMEAELNETQQDAYLVDENDGPSGSPADGVMPMEKYRRGSVPTRIWNKSRPHRQVRTTVHGNRDFRNALD